MSGPKVLHLVRHGQAMHNPKAEALREAGCTYDEFIAQMRADDCFDAPLTPLGTQQSRDAAAAMAARVAVADLELLVASPLSRALDTAELVFGAATCPRVCLESLREINGDMVNAKRRCSDATPFMLCPIRLCVARQPFLCCAFTICGPFPADFIFSKARGGAPAAVPAVGLLGACGRGGPPVD